MKGWDVACALLAFIAWDSNVDSPRYDESIESLISDKIQYLYDSIQVCNYVRILSLLVLYLYNRKLKAYEIDHSITHLLYLINSSCELTDTQF